MGDSTTSDSTTLSTTSDTTSTTSASTVSTTTGYGNASCTVNSVVYSHNYTEAGQIDYVDANTVCYVTGCDNGVWANETQACAFCIKTSDSSKVAPGATDAVTQVSIVGSMKICSKKECSTIIIQRTRNLGDCRIHRN